MKERELRRSMAVFPMGAVMELTDLSARQIRYYEDQGLIFPARNDGNRRKYSLNDMDVLLEIKDYLNDGLNIAGIKKLYEKSKEALDEVKNKSITDAEVRKILEEEIMQQSRFNQPKTTLR
ncbi:MerR family transcriptional regulator [Pseudolactococcus plantarum]|uniref:MerR family transcriptional regulator n=1 Tax=Pseudolactococcus plantarum TaxID=1365 RepID=A0A2A5RYY0_9LACT|nr:MerR family transcriptional regulator [Lactococcus plantarum]PCS06451.1 MerR family transcriptional regulator [Lactococcus plantarum]HCN74269.1 MerR family transcriptional regulator [Lactococcus sp.]